MKRKGGREWLQQLLSKFGPMTDRSPNAFVLDFEKPLVELDNRIKEVRKVAEENGVDVTEQIAELEARAKQLRKDTYSRLTATQRLQVARHPNRPTFLDIAMNVTDSFIELHGDRAGLDDKAMVAGMGSIDGIPMMFIGHQKGRNTKENIERNFGMPQPNGFRKALRFMKHADKFGFPIVTFVDTPGAYAGLKAEELGQGEAIARNLWEMFSFRVPILTIVIGEGGSGGALAIACGNKVYIMENAVYYVASPEACAAILWKGREKAGEAAQALKITAGDLKRLKVIDEVVPEPLGGAHSDPMSAFPAVKDAIMSWYEQYKDMSGEEIIRDRYQRYRKFGAYAEFVIKGGQVSVGRGDRYKSDGVYTMAGTWAANEEEKEYIEKAVDYEEQWESNLKGKEEWIWKPEVPREELESAERRLERALEAVRELKDKPTGSTVRPLVIQELGKMGVGIKGQSAPDMEEAKSNGKVPQLHVMGQQLLGVQCWISAVSVVFAVRMASHQTSAVFMRRWNKLLVRRWRWHRCTGAVDTRLSKPLGRRAEAFPHKGMGSAS
ncbi:unnamed protein product [Ostreobium quekettii]|uniref:acetyl-CoA carboxytransferase n=1 Tax=Ostreobium quekettii TaxID=121088 RepID=A0A8S1IW85_9CHLO|nr:unnamed protein product [Ostreobium quekettii]